MKIPYRLKCPDCSAVQTPHAPLHESELKFTCDSCGSEFRMPLPLDMQAGFRLLEKSKQAVRDQDWCLSIVLSAAALDCDLSFRYFKWRGIDELVSFSEITDEELEKELRRFHTIDVKIEEVCRFLDSERGLEGFVAADKELTAAVKAFPGLSPGSIARDLQRNLFWSRNRILHLGDTERFGEEDALRCFNLARLGVLILHRMDYARRGKR